MGGYFTQKKGFLEIQNHMAIGLEGGIMFSPSGRGSVGPVEPGGNAPVEGSEDKEFSPAEVGEALFQTGERGWKLGGVLLQRADLWKGMKLYITVGRAVMDTFAENDALLFRELPPLFIFFSRKQG